MLLKNNKNLKEIPNISNLEEELDRVNKKIKFNKAVRSTIYGLIVVTAVAILVATLWMPILQIYGNSMIPAISEGDIVLSLKSKSYSRGDVVGLYYGNKLLVKRIIAGPGDIVDFDYDGNVYVNNEKLEETYIKDKAYGEITIRLPYQVPENRWFVLGDHRQTSIDSRNQVVGAIADEQIVGRIVFRIWPINNLGNIN
ncbi:signal peptidase I [Peptoniphilus olsenii]|uniref:Signal peptidase I n=1 Tax=Peptoniphilus olsenii TaxID=411570 RepID=A0ABV2J9X4_9FIRM